MNDNSDVQTPREIGGASICEASTITDASNNTEDRVPTTIDEKKKKIEAVYASSSWMDEDRYETLKVKSLIRTNVFKNLKFVKGEGRKTLTNNFEKKTAKILQYGKCHEKADLTKANGYVLFPWFIT